MNSKSVSNFFISSIVLWLLVIVTVPWNIHFQAKEVLEDPARA